MQRSYLNEEERPLTERDIISEFKLQALSLQKDALKNILNVLKKERKPREALEMLLSGIQSYLERSNSSSTVVDSNCVAEVVVELSKNNDDFKAESLQVFSAFRTPRYKYNSARKKFYLDEKKPRIYADASSKINMYRDRFELIKQRILRQPAFASPLLKTRDSDKDYIKLTPLESLRGTNDRAFVFAMLTSPEEGKYALEDLHAKVACKFADDEELALAPGMYTDGCIVLVEGIYDIDDTDSGSILQDTGGMRGVFKILSMSHPPPESREDSLVAMGIVDPLRVLQTPSELSRAMELQTRADDAYWVILSDVHLDVPNVMENLRYMLQVYTDIHVYPSVFILMGDFCSTPFGAHSDDADTFSRRMDDLCDLLTEFPQISTRAQFVLVPGPNDPGSGHVLPRHGLPQVFCKRLLSSLPNVTLATNPCRIRFYSHEVFVYRDDVTGRLMRNSIRSTTRAVQATTKAVDVTDINDDDSPMQDNSTADQTTNHSDSLPDSEQAVQTIISQSHVSPLHLRCQPVFWDYDHALRLYPLPDTLILGEDNEQYLHNYYDVCAFNPSSFPAEGRFIVYRPSQRTVEMSRLDKLA